MPKYLLKASYNAEGVRGVMKEGGSKREAAARALVKSLGGKVESFYFCHGDADANDNADSDQPQALPHDHAADGRRLAAKRETDADIARVLLDEMRHHAVNPDD